jgi:hypothetical protein
MAMTGFRTVSAGLGLLKEAPPEEIATRGVPRLVERIPAEHRDQAIQLAHWAYGGVAGAAFGLLPQGLRRLIWSGPAYGFAIWVGFEAGLAPLLGLRVSERTAAERIVLAADHLLYGAIVGAPARSS